MKVVLFSGLDERTPPVGYGSVEMLVHCAAQELTKLGHQVVVFATEDSADEILSICDFRPYMLRRGARHRGMSQEETDELKLEVMRLAMRAALSLEPDVIHNNDHTGILAWNEYGVKPAGVVTTAHWPFDQPVTGDAFRAAPGHNTIMVSRAQEQHARSLDFELSYRGVVYNCIAHENFRSRSAAARTERLAWVGRFDPHKGIEEAIAIARALGKPIVVAGKIDNYAKPYFDTVVQPLLSKHGELVEFRGEVSQAEASDLMASSEAFLMTTRYHESFGLVVVEALAAGTPVIATDRGAMRELISNGKNGFVVPMLPGNAIDVHGFVRAFRLCHNISANVCRQSAQRFHPARMAEGYVVAYQRMIERESVRTRRRATL